jgi:hypothetical protein
VFVPGKPFQPSLFLWIRPGAYPRVEYLEGSFFNRVAPALITNITLDRKGLPGANTLAYYEHLKIMAVKVL